jgi:hypothetical protein
MKTWKKIKRALHIAYTPKLKRPGNLSSSARVRRKEAKSEKIMPKN